MEQVVAKLREMERLRGTRSSPRRGQIACCRKRYSGRVDVSFSVLSTVAGFTRGLQIVISGQRESSPVQGIRRNGVT
jgi:hypothetical protein